MKYQTVGGEKSQNGLKKKSRPSPGMLFIFLEVKTHSVGLALFHSEFQQSQGQISGGASSPWLGLQNTLEKEQCMEDQTNLNLLPCVR